MPDIALDGRVAHGALDDLLDDRSQHIEFNGHLTNHVKHAVIALAAIGAPEERIRAYHDAYRALTPYGFPLEPARPSAVVINRDTWRDHRGQRVHFSAYYDFFAREVSEKGIDATVEEYAPELLRGWIGAFTHAAIHLGWAVYARHPAMTAEALGYLAFSYVEVLDEARDHEVEGPAASPAASVAALARHWTEGGTLRAAIEGVITDVNSFTDLHPELSRSGLQARVAGVAIAGLPELTARPSWIDPGDVLGVRDGLRRAATLLYLASPGDFVVLHLITALFALEAVAELLVESDRADLQDLYWAGARIILAAEGKIPDPQKVEELDALFGGELDADDPGTAEFATISRRAWLEDEEHNPKLVFVLKSWWDERPLALYRHAAGQFTQTPDLPPSFTEPPHE